ncbi:hypothetical protein TNCV_116601 [Trichonephila clavipes]|nr:hypothetical protein TNCV_116601 [Trichonephila clavipes]
MGLRSGEYAGHAIRAIPSLSRSSLRDAKIILRAGQRIISKINILIENSQGSSQIPKSNPQLLNAEIKKKIAPHENLKMLYEGDTRNRWRDGPVCPDVDQELWRLGPDSSGVFWRVMRQ